MIDLALHEHVEFSNLEYISSSFRDGINQNYDLFYIVNPNEDEQPRVVVISSNQRVELIFSPTATIGIKNSKLYFNPHNLIKIIRSCLSPDSQDGKHEWKENFYSTNLVKIACINCGHERLLATPDLIRQWKDNGFIS